METDRSRLLDALPGMIWTAGRDGACDFVNRQWRAYTGLDLEQAIAAGWLSLFHPEDVAGASAAWETTLSPTPPDEIRVEARLRRHDGVYRRFSLQTRALRDLDGQILGWCGTNTDIEDRSHAEAQLAAEKRLLELVARGTALTEVLTELCVQVEALSPGSSCSILLVDTATHRFRIGAGPSLPAAYSEILDGLKIDPGYGPCSLAVETGRTIIVTDPQNDRRWRPEGWPAAMAEHDLASCWSAPIFGSRDEVVGIFAIYRSEATGPTEEAQALIDQFSRIAGIAIKRAEADLALETREGELRRSNHFLKGGQRLSKTGSFSLDTSTDQQVWSEENYAIWEFDPTVAPTMDMVAATIHPDDREQMLKTFAEATDAKTGFDVLYRIVTPRGGVKYLHTVMEVIPEFTDRVVYLGSSQDVTEATLAAAALRESEERLARANAHLSMAQRLTRTGSFTWNAETLELEWSAENYRIWDYEPGVIPSMQLLADRLHPEDRDRFLEEVAAQRPEFDVSFRTIRPGGEVKYLHSVRTPIPEIGEHFFVGATQDVTEIRLAEQALKASEGELRRANQYLSGAQRLSKTGSFTWDVATDEQDWSDELYRIWELDPAEHLAVPALYANRVHPDDVAGIEAIVAPALQTGLSYEMSYRLITPRGGLKYVHTVNERVKEITDRLVYVGATQDLTQVRLGEEALRASEARLRRANRYLKAAQTISRIGSFTWDVESDGLDWSDENFRIWEVDPASTPTLGLVVAAIHPEDVGLVREVIERGRRSGEDFDVVYRIVTRNGVVKHLHTLATRVPEITDRLVYVGSNQDVTEARIAEASLKASEADLARANRYLQGAQSLSRIGSFTWDVADDVQDWSDENFRIWGFSPGAQPTMDKVMQAIHPEDLRIVVDAVGAMHAAADDLDIFYRITTPGGEAKHLHTVAKRAAEFSDRLVYVGSTQDVTATKLAEAELARANTYLLAAQRLSQTGSFTWDVEADEHKWSDVIFQVFGFAPGTKVTMDMMMAAIHPDDLRPVQELIAGAQIGENFELVFRVLRPDGDTRHAHVVGHRIDHIPERPVFMGALQDITARKLAEGDLNRAREELAHVSRVTALSTLTASIAHEVSQPLAGIITNSSTCVRLLGADPPDVAGALATAQRNLRDGNRASEVIKRLRALYARRPPSLEALELQDAAREVLALLASELQRRRVIVQADFAPGLQQIAADRVQLQQVILNLILNAADAMAEVTDRPRNLRISTYADVSGHAGLAVRDAGCGLDPAHAEKLFEAFHTTKPDGMGIGLSVSRSIIEAHGGVLGAAPNDEGPGATFSFSIPFGPAPAETPVSRLA